jgi:hypothetical protein
MEIKSWKEVLVVVDSELRSLDRSIESSPSSYIHMTVGWISLSLVGSCVTRRSQRASQWYWFQDLQHIIVLNPVCSSSNSTYM